jgi:excisionase family DNA binding protein
MTTAIESDLLTRAEAAAFLNIKPQTLACWASTHRVELPFVRIGKRTVRYRLSDLQRFVDRSTVTVGAST